MAEIILNLNASNSTSSTWYDNSGNGYDIALTDVVKNQYPISELTFNGSSSLGTSATVTTIFGSSGFSVEAYFKFTDISGTQGIFSYNGGGKYLNLQLRSGVVRWETAAGQQTNSVTPANDTGWVYLVATNDGATSKIYLNGILDATSAKTCITSANTIFEVGFYEGYFNGQLNTLNLYQGALTAEEIAANYNSLKNQPIGVNQFYEYTADMEGSFSGGTLPAGTNVPHPEYATDTDTGVQVVIQLNMVTIGGFNGLNN